MNPFNFKYFKLTFLPASIVFAGYLIHFDNTTLMFIYGGFLYLLPWIMTAGQRNSMYASYETETRFRLDNRKFFLIWLFSHGFVLLAAKVFGR